MNKDRIFTIFLDVYEGRITYEEGKKLIAELYEN